MWLVEELVTDLLGYQLPVDYKFWMVGRRIVSVVMMFRSMSGGRVSYEVCESHMIAHMS
jgi:hypothetical protein